MENFSRPVGWVENPTLHRSIISKRWVRQPNFFNWSIPNLFLNLTVLLGFQPNLRLLPSEEELKRQLEWERERVMNALGRKDE